jgi:hypothetical protein
VARSSAVSTSIKQPCSVSLEHLGRGEGQTFPLNTYGGKKAPFVGKVVSIERLGGRDKERDASHIVIDTGALLLLWCSTVYQLHICLLSERCCCFKHSSSRQQL